MPDPTLDFNFYAGGLEDGILELLKTPLKAIGVKGFATYSGELDSPEAIKAAISGQTIQFPLVMVAYAGGDNANDPRTSAVLGRSRTFRHDCSYGVIVVDNNPQGETKRRRSKVFQMLSVVWSEMTDRRLKTEVEGEEILLNVEPFSPAETIVIPKLPNMTAICQVFDTAFRWKSVDRTEDGIPVSDVVVDVDSLNGAGANPGNLPGVTFQIEA